MFYRIRARRYPQRKIIVSGGGSDKEIIALSADNGITPLSVGHRPHISVARKFRVQSQSAHPVDTIDLIDT